MSEEQKVSRSRDERVAELEEALGLALDYLVRFEPGDSRAVSDEFVAMASVAADLTNAECMAIIRGARAAHAKAEGRP